APPAGGPGGRLPTVAATPEGRTEVVFDNDCAVIYDPRGRRLRATMQCTDDQVGRADLANEAWRRDNGLG
ncbi:MAG: hypothetical protein AAF677_11880, partial [Pseudomonadota bacterium]